MLLKIGTRKSALARIQSQTVAEALKQADPSVETELVLKESLGDLNQTTNLSLFASKGVFTEDLNRALLDGEIDLAVHSWKDLPTEPREKTKIAATLGRADPRDLVLLRPEAFGKSTLQILSSSPRREFNLKDFLPLALPWKIEEIDFLPVRGNIETRIRKLLEENADGLIVAKAALDRLLSSKDEEFSASRKFIGEALSRLYLSVAPLSVNPCAPGQGALAIECLSDRKDLIDILSKINHSDVYEAVEIERARLQDFGGGCHQKIGIAVLRKPYGLVYFSRGEPMGSFIEVAEIQAGLAVPPAGSRDRVWPQKETSFSFKRSALKHEIPLDPNTGIFCAKDSAWPENFTCSPSTIVWAAGVTTWKALAARGVWVHGCNDSLGEHEDFSLAQLFPHITRWIKLSHAEATVGKFQKLVPTYSLIPERVPSSEELLRYTHFYWSSSSQFKLALERAPGIAERIHGSGPGATHNLIASKVPNLTRLSTHLSFDGFLEAALEH